MKNNLHTLHPRQIPTTLKFIKSEFFHYGLHAIKSLLRCLASEPGSFKQKNHLLVAAISFERMSCLVYRGKNGNYRKPPIEEYITYTFEGFAETPEEIIYQLNKCDMAPASAEHMHRIIWKISDLICPMMSCLSEQAFVSEYAYAIEYVILHDGNLPKPKIPLLFPINYPDYNYREGIANEIKDYEI